MSDKTKIFRRKEHITNLALSIKRVKMTINSKQILYQIAWTWIYFGLGWYQFTKWANMLQGLEGNRDDCRLTSMHSLILPEEEGIHQWLLFILIRKDYKRQRIQVVNSILFSHLYYSLKHNFDLKFPKVETIILQVQKQYCHSNKEHIWMHLQTTTIKPTKAANKYLAQHVK